MSEIETPFLAWKKNTQHLYDGLYMFELPWPSISVNWIPELIFKGSKTGPSSANTKVATDAKPSAVSPYTTKQRLILATNTGNQHTEYLRVAELTCPPILNPASLGTLDTENGIVGSHQSSQTADMHIVQRIQLKGVAQQTSVMPQNPNIVAVVSDTGNCGIFDITKFPSRPLSLYKPTVALEGQYGAETLCVDWSPSDEGSLATGDSNGVVRIFNLRQGYDSHTGSMQPLIERNHIPNTAVNDVRWHPRRPAILATCGDDGWLYVHNTVSSSGGVVVSKFLATKKVHEAPQTEEFAKVGDKPEGPRIPPKSNENTETIKLEHLPTSLAWNPVNESLLVVGYDTGDIQLWDLRKEPTLIFIFHGPTGHHDYITKLAWNPWNPAMLVSASVDKTVKVWNVANLGLDPIFTHGGHQAPVTDVAWNPAVPQMLASVAEDNGLHIYVPSDDILGF